MLDVVLVVAGVIEKDGKVLIAQRSNPDDPLFNTWEFPGGKVRPGETPQISLMRELQEELNIIVDVGDLLVEGVYAYPHISIKLQAYRCVWKAGDIKLNSHGAYKWVFPEEVSNYNLSPADYMILEKLLKTGTDRTK
ncbi:MAG: (deoxy)nucleoside triphosphate pyrophosphohydrolase [Thermodesulforhabdaceae bacterium]